MGSGDVPTANAAKFLLCPNLSARPEKIAFVDDNGAYSFASLDQQSAAFAGYLLSQGFRAEERVLMVLEDSIAFPVVWLGATRLGMVPVMANPLLPVDDLAYLVDDSRARLVVASPAAWPRLEQAVRGKSHVRGTVLTGRDAPDGIYALDMALAHASFFNDYATTHEDEACMWQYSSGSTGRPKGTIHSHGALIRLASLYPQEVLHLRESDVTFSAAKMFFGYGFGNSLIFPLAAGATTLLMAERPTAEAVWRRIITHSPTVFYGVPTLYNNLLLLQDACAPVRLDPLRACVSAGEALSPEIAQRWRRRYGVPILDGIGSTEMLHIYVTNRMDDVQPGSIGRPVAGYNIRLVDEAGNPVRQGEIGEMHIDGPTSASGYWCKREKTAATFLGRWVASGDKFIQDGEGRYTFCGRSDDMLKVGGIWVSPLEVEQALTAHAAVIEAAVVGWPDDAGLIKPKAYVVLAPGHHANKALDLALKSHVKELLAPYKYPRWIEFVDDLPKTTSGKIERYRLRPDTDLLGATTAERP